MKRQRYREGREEKEREKKSIFIVFLPGMDLAGLLILQEVRR
jgi:hypothetical protein